jgi:hypothetical protein
LGLALLVSNGCQTTEIAAPVNTTGISVAMRLPTGSDVTAIRFSVNRVSCDGEAVEPFSLTTDKPLEEIRLPGGIPAFEDAPFDGDSSHAFADFFVDLAPGCYKVFTQPLGLDGNPSPRCSSASAASVRVLDGQTTEIFLINQCQGEGRGAIDVVAALNEPPELKSLVFAKSKFVQSCEEQRVCATVRDPDGDPVELSWEQVSGAELDSGPVVVESRTNSDGSVTECILMVAKTPGRYEMKVSAFDKLRDPDTGLLVRFEDYFASHGYPQLSRIALTFPFYAAEGDGGACLAHCTHPSAETLAAYDPSSVHDIVFDAQCNAYLSTIINGVEHVYKMDGAGKTNTITGYSVYDIPAVAVDPRSGQVVVGHNLYHSNCSVGIASENHISVLADGAYSRGELWTDSIYLNACLSSITVDATGCVWTPNFAGSGTLVCVDLATGSQRTVSTLAKRIEGISWTATQGLLLSSGADIFAVDTTTGSNTLRFTAPAPILDFAVDAKNGDLYIETTAHQVLRVTRTGVASVFATVEGQGKLAISPDRFLVRVRPILHGESSYQEWELEH